MSDSTAADWDLSSYFSSLGGDDYRRHWADLEERTESVARLATALPLTGPDLGEQWASLVEAAEALQIRLSHLRSYLSCLTAAQADDERAQTELAKYGRLMAEQLKLHAKLQSKLRALSEPELDEVLAEPRLKTARFPLLRLRQRATWQMEQPEEELAAELGVTGIEAWGRLYNRISGSLKFELAIPGKQAETRPASTARTLMQDDDPAVRRAAFAGVNAAWCGVEEPVAACLNAISGTRHTLYERRGVEHFLDPALLDACIERPTLDAMLGAVRARQGIARRFLRLKAKLMGMERLSFCDLEASIPRQGSTRISWERGQDQVVSAFTSYPALHDFARRAIDSHWIDHTPRRGKRPGAFCSSSRWNDESRVFMTFGGSASDTQTLAHELGHAFHAHLLFDRRPWCRSSPMTLAETASLFAEQLVTQHLLESPTATDEQRLLALEGRLSDAATFLLNIPTRFDFEVALYEERRSGEVSVSRLKELMLRAQRDNYADTLAEEGLDPMFWASKLHFYITQTSFYNFPYTFGFLFALGLFALYRRKPDGFFSSYEALLRSTGSGTAEEVTKDCAGVDISTPAFWHSCLDLVEADLDAFEALAKDHRAG